MKIQWFVNGILSIMILTCSGQASEPKPQQTKPEDGYYYMPEDVKLLDDGNVLVAFGCNPEQTALGDLVAIFSPNGDLIREIHSGKCGIHTVEIMPDGSYLISEKDDGEVARLTTNGEKVWTFRGAGLSCFRPNDAILAKNGNYLISDACGKLLEVSSEGKILWTFALDDTIHFHDVDELESGNLLFCISGKNRVVEIDKTGKVVWEYNIDLDWPRNVERLKNGNTLITDKNKCIELDKNFTIVWKAPIGGYNTVRTDAGDTYICTTKGVVKLNQKGEIVWNLAFRIPPSEDIVTKGLTIEKIQELKMIGYID